MTIKNNNDTKPKIIPYAKQWISDEDIAAVSEVLQSSFLTTGPNAEVFEQSLCSLTGAKHAVVCANGTAALHLACMALGISQGDLGVTSPNTFLASANCVEFCGGRADFVDIDIETLCISPEKLEEYCLKHAIPKVVIPVDFAGIPSNLPFIKELADKYGFYVIEDAAHSIGSTYTYRGQMYQCGSCAHSDLATFSFHPVKTITSGEGGAILTNNDILASRLRTLRTHGMVRCQDLIGEKDGPWYYEMDEISYNYRITDFQCALGNSQLRRINEFKKRRLEIVSIYNKALKNNDKVIIPPLPLMHDACPHLYPLQFTEGNRKRYEVFHTLRDQNILCQIHYIPVYWQPHYKKKYGYQRGKCLNAEKYYSRCLSLPLFPAMTDDDVRNVIEKLKVCFF